MVWTLHLFCARKSYQEVNVILSMKDDGGKIDELWVSVSGDTYRRCNSMYCCCNYNYVWNYSKMVLLWPWNEMLFVCFVSVD